MPGNAQMTPGPILHYVSLPGFNTAIAYFLGTHVTSPKQRAEFYEIPVYNDLGGRSARFQSVADGEEWKISTTLNRFDYNVVRAIRYLKSGSNLIGTPGNPVLFPLTGLNTPLGTSSPFGRGSLVMGLQDFQLHLINTFAGTTAAGLPTIGAVDLNNIRSYQSCSITAYEEEAETTRVLEVSMAIEARGLFNPGIAAATFLGQLVPARGFSVYLEGAVPGTIAFSPVT